MILAEWAHDLSESHLRTALPQRWAHVSSVAAEARRIAEVVAPDGDLLVAAAILHDVGYAPELVRFKFHPLDGARYLQEQEAPVRLCALVAHHSAAAHEARLRNLDHLLDEFEDEACPVRDALWYCDLVTGPDGSRVTFAERLDEITRRYGPGDIVTEFVRVARPDLAAAVQRTQERMRVAGLAQPM